MHKFTRSSGLALAAILAIAGCSGEDGSDGASGAPGADAPLPAGKGFQLTVQSATIPASGVPTVTFQALDASGNPVDVIAETTAGAFGSRGIRFTFAARQADGTLRSLYESSGAATYSPRGTFTFAQLAAMMTRVSDGVYRFTAPAAPATAPVTTTVHTVGAWASRTVDAVGYPAADTLDFTPSTGAAATARAVVTDAACNECHKNMQAHGSRRTVGLCLTCHYPGFVDADTSENIDFRSMVHKIHNATYTLGDFTNVVFPDIANGVKNCALCHGAVAPTPSIAACGSCHTALSPTHGGANACTSCHDNSTAPSPAKAHSETYDAGTNLTLAAPKVTVVIDSIDPNVTAPTVTFTVTDAAGAPVTALARSTFCVLPAEASIDPALSCGSLRFSIGGPTADFGSGALNSAGSGYGYLQSVSFTGTDTDFARITPTATPGQYVAPLVSGTNVAKFAAAAGASVGIGAEVYVLETVATVSGGCGTGALTSAPAESATCAVREWAAPAQPMKFAVVGDGAATPVARREITDNAKCNKCHNDLGFHGGEARKTPEYCAICHHPNNVNEERSTRLEFTESAPGVPTTTPFTATPNSVSLMSMAHKLHAGSALSTLFVLGADRSLSAAAPYADEVSFPGAFVGDLGDCATCHRPGTWGLPKSTNLGLLQVTYTCTDRAGDADNFCDTLVLWPATTSAAVTDVFLVTAQKVIPPQTSACTSCHDSDAAKAHAELNTTAGGVESCEVCHGVGSTYDVFEVHQPAP